MLLFRAIDVETQIMIGTESDEEGVQQTHFATRTQDVSLGHVPEKTPEVVEMLKMDHLN